MLNALLSLQPNVNIAFFRMQAAHFVHHRCEQTNEHASLGLVPFKFCRSGLIAVSTSIRGCWCSHTVVRACLKIGKVCRSLLSFPKFVHILAMLVKLSYCTIMLARCHHLVAPYFDMLNCTGTTLSRFLIFILTESSNSSAPNWNFIYR